MAVAAACVGGVIRTSVHGVITAIDPDTGEILVDQTLDTTREYQRRRPLPNVNHAPGHA
ncbi:hypothetical protein [Bifidobacterium callitrichos]|uniref:hypothetical protein n=1 Tax=Bifidobacterium callitrichos TaxID=762209 RepID=UPI0015E73216|nr:hypothetical protein [Bifidobacterium callitrichos]